LALYIQVSACLKLLELSNKSTDVKKYQRPV
jgi:hypothetical protein